MSVAIQRTDQTADRCDTTIAPELHALFDRIPALSGKPRTVSELSGGLTNKNYRVTTVHDCYVVRVSPRESDLLSIDRATEYANSVSAANAGVGAPVIDFLPDDGVLVIGFIHGVTLTDEDVVAPGNLKRIAESCRRLHSAQRFTNDFDMFHVQASYLGIVQERGFRLPTGYLDYMEQVQAVARALAVCADGTVPCNNDLLAGNFVDDGSQIRLIDYEYSGNNDPCFELGNIWSECKLDLDHLEELVTAYYGRHLRNKIARAQLQGLMSKYGWTLWASIQDASSALEFDFWSWGMEKYDAAIEAFTSPNFARLLDEVQRMD
jgi:thiamine kinase-like enzyme